jgi:hypothetical protein
MTSIKDSQSMALELSAPAAQPARQDAATGRFFAAILASNPFAINRVADPTQMEADVSSIHGAAFDELIERARTACHEGRGIGALLLGEQGVGKSHLLARLSRWASGEGKACYIFLTNIRVGPADMERYLLKCCISKLAEDRLASLHDTLLFRVVWEAISRAAHEDGITRLNDANRQDVYRRLANRLGGDERVFDVIFRFFWSTSRANSAKTDKSRHEFAQLAALTVRWLKGDILDANEAKAIGQRVAPEHDTAQLADDQVQEVWYSIARLARYGGRPFVLCVDQADTMLPDQLQGLGSTLQCLLDRSTNLLAVVSGVRDEINARIDDGIIPGAVADRLDRTHPLELRRIKRSEACSILQSRLEHFREQFEDLPESCKPFFADDSLFPIDSAWFDKVEPGSLELRPRDVLTWAQDRWKTIQQRIRTGGGAAWLANWRCDLQPPTLPTPEPDVLGQAIDGKIAKKIEETINRRDLDRGTLPADAANLLGLTRQLLEQCRNRPELYSLAAVDIGGKHDVGLIVREDHRSSVRTNAVQFIVTGSKISAASQLRKLLSCDADYRVLVTDHERYPLPLGPKGQEYFNLLDQLNSGESIPPNPNARKFTHMKLSFKDYATLDAMISVISEAQSRDLEIMLPSREMVEVKPDQVIQSYHRTKRYVEHPLLRIFLTELPQNARSAGRYPPSKEFVKFICSELPMMGERKLTILTEMFFREHPQEGVVLPSCLARAKEIARECHRRRLLTAIPWDDDLLLSTFHGEESKP